MQKTIQNVEKFGADAPILHIYHNITRIENSASRYRPKKAAKNGEEVHIPEIWVGEKIRVFGQNIHPCLVEVTKYIFKSLKFEILKSDSHVMTQK